MRIPALTEPQFYAFVERFDGFTAQLSPQERHFLTTVLLRACACQAPGPLSQGGHPDSAVHAHLAYALWQSTQSAESFMPPNPLPLPPS
jgi:hypothetical protein